MATMMALLRVLGKSAELTPCSDEDSSFDPESLEMAEVTSASEEWEPAEAVLLADKAETVSVPLRVEPDQPEAGPLGISHSAQVEVSGCRHSHWRMTAS